MRLPKRSISWGSQGSDLLRPDNKRAAQWLSFLAVVQLFVENKVKEVLSNPGLPTKHVQKGSVVEASARQKALVCV